MIYVDLSFEWLAASSTIVTPVLSCLVCQILTRVENLMFSAFDICLKSAVLSIVVAEVQILHGKNRQILAGEIFVSWPQAILPWPTTPATSDAAVVVNESVETPPVAESPGQRRVRGPGAPSMPQKGIKRWLLYFGLTMLTMILW